MQFFLKFINFYQKFIKKYSHVITSLIDIIRKKQEFHREEKAQEAFERLKQLFTEELILQMFDSRRLTVMKVNASDQVLNSVLSQQDKSENLHSVAFHS